MTGVLLDIGAGSTRFVRRFRKHNRHSFKLTYLCGEPEWRGNWDGEKRDGRIQKIRASYSSFNVPDASLVIVTLNAPHPFVGTGGIETELVRTLKPAGGIFISAHPVGNHPVLSDEYFYPVAFCPEGADETPPKLTLRFELSAQFGLFLRAERKVQIDRWPMMSYPASPTICNRLRHLLTPPELQNGDSGYIYSSDSGEPTIKVWMRNDRPAP